MCKIFHKAGCFFSIENPRTSYAWKYGPIHDLLEFGFDVHFDQCMYELLPPHLRDTTSSHSSKIPLKPTQPKSNSNFHGKTTKPTFIKKPTTVRTNVAALAGLSLACSRQHEHFLCCGSVKTSQGWVSVAKAAGNYPSVLVGRWAELLAGAAK